MIDVEFDVCLAVVEILAFGGMGFAELLVIGAIAVILFGKNLPEVARSLGHSYTQFRRGLQDIQSEVYTSTYTNDYSSSTSPKVDRQTPPPEDRDVPTAPKFEPPTSEPKPVDEPPA